MSGFEIHCGDALEVLRTMPDESVNCCITSPPYYGLRDYGTAKWEGGDAECSHKERMARGDTERETPGGRGGSFRGGEIQYRELCAQCGATRVDSQIGLERTPTEYIARLVEVFREVRRVLKSDGTLWVNIGDSYSAHPEQRKTTDKVGLKQETNRGSNSVPSRCVDGLKRKDLIGIPWTLAFALRDDGWWLRQDIIWAKGNCMPESVRDRCTKAHEYIFMLSKSARYYYDSDAIKEPTQPDSIARYGRGRADDAKYADGGPGGQTIARTFDHMQPKQDGYGRRHAGFKGREFSGDPREMRNKRSWWLMNTAPTPEAHFATFPLELPEICLKAGCPEGGVVLDPFAGAGTTGLACLKNNRGFRGIELNPAYIEIAYKRAEKHFPLLMGALCV